MNTSLMFSSETGRWDTPTDLVADLATVFKWDVDVCAERPNVCDNFYSPDEDGLSQEWHGLCWCNPPYGREIGKWVEKGVDSADDEYSEVDLGLHWEESDDINDETKDLYRHLIANRTSVVFLVPARTDTKWWQENVPYATMVVFIAGRLTFGSDESWVARWCEKWDNGGARDELVSRVGGALLKKHRPDIFDEVSYKWDAKNQGWETSSHLKKGSAPFPSAFVVFGQLTRQEKNKLADYGWVAAE